MKKLFIFLFFSIFFISGILAADLTEGLVAHYLLDGYNYDSSTGKVIDSTIFLNHGTNTGATLTTGVNDEADGAMSFDTSSLKYITIADSANPSIHTKMTLSSWVFPRSTGGSDSMSTIIMSSSGYYLSYNDADKALSCYWYGTSPAGYHTTSSNSVPLNQWSHVSCVWDGSYIREYVNGVLLNTVGVTGAGNDAGTHLIGAESTSRQLDGKISDLRIYNRSLSGDEIKFLYDSYKKKGAYSATGCTKTTDGAYTVHTCTSNDYFNVTGKIEDAEVLIVGGGGGGGGDGYGGTGAGEGGGGAGGLVYLQGFDLYGNISVVVGAGGAGGANSGTYNVGNNGGNSTFNGVVAFGGGGGGAGTIPGKNGGSGGGASYTGAGGDADFISPRQGYDGAAGTIGSVPFAGAGGGGAGGAGQVAASASSGGAGGVGLSYSITGSSVTYATGGKGADGWNVGNGVNGAANTGNGGTGAGGGTGGAGGSGVVIIKYLTYIPKAYSATGCTKTTDGDYTVHTCTSNDYFNVTGEILNATVLVVAGGGGGGSSATSSGGGGGGGAGGLNYSTGLILSKSYVVTVGNGGSPGATGANAMGTSGGNSSLGSLVTAVGGGGGANTGSAGLAGGSGGGAGYNFYSSTRIGGVGTPGQGFAGGNTSNLSWAGGAGGGGAGGVGGPNKINHAGGDAGPGLAYSITGSSVTYAVGGTGGSNSPAANSANTGYGGDAAYAAGTAYAGSSGIVVIRYLTYVPSLPSITFEPPTPNNGSSSSDLINIIANISEINNIMTSSWLDFDRTLKGYWAMDYFNGSGIYDNSTFGNFATFAGGVGVNNLTRGMMGQALTFDGDSDYLDTSLDPSTLGQEITIDAWVYPTAQNNYDGIWGNHGSTGVKGILLQYDTTGWYAGFGNGSAWKTHYIGSLDLNKWTHLVVVFKGGSTSASYIKSYKNTVENKTNLIASISHENDFWIGRAYNNAGRYFQGMIDEVRIFNRTLSYEEILASYNSRANKFDASLAVAINSGRHNYTLSTIDQQGDFNTTGLRYLVVDSCVYDGLGNWEINLSHYCIISINTTLKKTLSPVPKDGGNISFVDVGNVTFDATIYADKIYGLPENQRGYLTNRASLNVRL